MKKLFILVLIGTIFLFSFCKEESYTAVVKNDSSKTVSYVYNGGADSLSPDKFKVYKIEEYTQPPKSISVPGAMSVRMKRNGDIYIFENVDPIDLIVTNDSGVEVILKADKYIDAGGNKTEMELDVGDAGITATIYTANPNFTTVPSRPVTWNHDPDENEMTVTIGIL